jgi:hypothetical protein
LRDVERLIDVDFGLVRIEPNERFLVVIVEFVVDEFEVTFAVVHDNEVRLQVVPSSPPVTVPKPER